MPPYDLIFSSYALHSFMRSFAFPLRMFTCDGGMSTATRTAAGQFTYERTWGGRSHSPWEKNSRNMKVW